MKTQIQTRIGLAVGLILALLTGLAPRAGAAGYEMPITFGGYTNRSEALTNFPVLVVFSNEVGSSGFSFSSHPFVTTTGYDLRFYTNSTDTGSGLNYEIESWNTNSASYVWVQVPLIPTNGTGSIYAKWGATTASNQLACTTNGAVWTNGFAAVWHMGTTNSAGQLPDSMTGNYTGTLGSAASEWAGQIGSGRKFDGTANSYVNLWDVLDGVFAGANKQFVMEGWVRPLTNNMVNNAIFNKYVTTSNQREHFLRLSTLSKPQFVWYGDGTSSHVRGTLGQTPITDTNRWYHIVAIYDGTNATVNSRVSLFVNGIQEATSIDVSAGTPTSIFNSTAPLALGAFFDGVTAVNPINGVLDEMRISQVLRSSNWVWATYMTAASNTLFSTYGTASATDTSIPQIENRAPSGVATNGATFNGYLVDNGSENASVYVLWGGTNGIDSPPWAYTNGWLSGAWANGSAPATNITLEPNANYYYRFGATNSTTNVMATLPQSYQYLITGEVTVQPTDPTGRVTLADTAAFTVYRPASCTNEAITVAYTLGGTATNVTHYTNSPAAVVTNGTVTIGAGQTNAVVTVYPLNVTAPEQTVVLSLVSGNYALGSANSATCTLVEATAWVAGSNRYWVAAGSGNWNNTANWSFAPYGPGGWSVPASTNVAFFDGGGTGDCTINAAVNVLGINIGSGYGGTITQGAVTIAVGNTGWAQAGGTFTGSASAITLTGTTAGFSLTGGSFTAGAGQAIILSGTTANFDVSGGTFNPSTSTVSFTGGGSASDNSNLSTGPNSLYNCVFAKGNYGNVTAVGTVTISGKLTLTSGHRLTGNFNVAGDVETASSVLDNQNTSTITLNGTGSQTISNTGGGGRLPGIIINKGGGTASLVGVLTIIGANSPFTQTAGSLDAGTSTLIFAGGGNSADLSNLTVTDPLYNLTQNKGASYGRLNVVGSVTVNNNLAITDGHGLLGTIYVKGNVSQSAANSTSLSTAAITLNGTGDQTISNTSGTFPSGTLTINKASGTVTLGSNVSLATAGQDLIWTSGGLDLSTYTLTVTDQVTIASSATTLGVTVAGAAPSNGRLTCGGAVSGLNSAGLAVTVTATEAQVLGQTYTILSNVGVLGAQFESVTWQDSWKGVVDYNANSGKSVTLSGICEEEGTVFRFR